jgi:tRNA(fMet)-specific endonuclease VapC
MESAAAEDRAQGDRGLSFLLDTDTCSAYVKGNARLASRFVQYGGGLHISAVTLGELLTWALRTNAPPRRQHDVQNLLNQVTVLDVTPDVAAKFGQIRAALFDAGTPAPELDLLIAATALVHGLTLVTHNTADFNNVPGLSQTDWLIP